LARSSESRPRRSCCCSRTSTAPSSSGTRSRGGTTTRSQSGTETLSSTTGSGQDCLAVSAVVSLQTLRRQLDDGGFFIARRTTFRSLQELVEHYTRDADGLCVNLRKPCVQVQTFLRLSNDSTRITNSDTGDLNYAKSMPRLTFLSARCRDETKLNAPAVANSSRWAVLPSEEWPTGRTGPVFYSLPFPLTHHNSPPSFHAASGGERSIKIGNKYC
jgi:hypothetical protein